jgi:hypothetical protein
LHDEARNTCYIRQGDDYAWSSAETVPGEAVAIREIGENLQATKRHAEGPTRG